MEEKENNFILPPVNMSEDEYTYYYKIIAPGLDKSELDITILDDKHMVVSGNYRAHIEDVRFPQAPSYIQPKENKEVIQEEYSLTSFSRNIELFDDVDISSIKSWYQEGILYVEILKDSSYKEVKRFKVDILDPPGISGAYRS